MNSIMLDDDEAIAINAFINEVSDNILTDGILLFPFYDNNNQVTLNVIVIRNISLQYTYKILGSNTIPMRSTKLKEIDGIVSKYNMLFNNKRLSFKVTNIDDYNVTLMHEKELMHMRELLSSTILYDRFGDIKERQGRQIKYVSKYKNLPKVINLDTIVSNDKKLVKGKKKNQ